MVNIIANNSHFVKDVDDTNSVLLFKTLAKQKQKM